MRIHALGLALLVACSPTGETGGSAASSSSSGASSAGQGASSTSSATSSMPASSSMAEGRMNDAEIVSSTLPSSLACGASSTATVIVRNTGSQSWTREGGYKLGAVDDSDPLNSEGRIQLDEGVTIPPGATHAFQIPLVAPSTAGSVTSDWRMVQEGVEWFGATVQSAVSVECQGRVARRGRVRLEGSLLVDDDGPFNALGTTMMWAAWGYKNDRARVERTLDDMASRGIMYIRALGVVGHPTEPDYWDGREIDWHWPDYDDVIAGLTDLVYSKGMRIEWTLIGDGQLNLPNASDRYALVDRFLAMSAGREHKIMHFEIANEAWQNGFPGPEGVTQLRELTEYMRDRTDILVATSAPVGAGCEDYEALYAPIVADLATIHLDRDVSTIEEHWRPVRQPWSLMECNLPVASNNEPIGPGSSVASENHPIHLVSAAIVSYIAKVPFYVFHTRAGVWGADEWTNMEGTSSFQAVMRLLPSDLTGWTPKNAHWADSVFRVYAFDAGDNAVVDAVWPDLTNPRGGVVRAYGAVKGNEFVAYPMGILNRVRLEARRAMTFDVIEPLTGAVVEQRALAPGESFELGGGEAFLIKGRFQ